MANLNYIFFLNNLLHNLFHWNGYLFHNHLTHTIISVEWTLMSVRSLVGNLFNFDRNALLNNFLHWDFDVHRNL